MKQKIDLPKVIFGTSGLGNLYEALSDSTKYHIVKQSVEHSASPVVFDSAGKYGAGLALQSLGEQLKLLGVHKDNVLISNKLGWLRTKLTTAEPTFEPGVWKNLKHDAVQSISYEGILKCYEQGNDLLKGYNTSLVSVHDPDEYLAAAIDEDDKARRYEDILAAYQALADLKSSGHVKAIGVGAKNWKVIQRLAADVELDWIMIANSMTLHSHPAGLIEFMQKMQVKGTAIINSAVFNAGFLTGGDFYNYRRVTPETHEGKALFAWRNQFNMICNQFNIKPVAACVLFGLSAPGVISIALNTTNPDRVKQNIALAEAEIPADFWIELSEKGLIDADYLPLLLNKI
ncbi:aldo/keto reductase [Mucilaginibacter flavus]|uniref:aldo/keto reductase n=1 Tax=Mucilaginibacter flavus TaxID=931504 RepID=UPI0025B2EA7C|nr:aldo/keto reductase [Mucilaginibacter flavus]MDN3580328.1 aldo/keto reductase [Mucilaginibacter flavus]